jgi:hypothetical protein
MARTGHDSERAAMICQHEARGGLGAERVTRIELALSAWEADVLPLNYTRMRPERLLRARALARQTDLPRHRTG